MCVVCGFKHQLCYANQRLFHTSSHHTFPCSFKELHLGFRSSADYSRFSVFTYCHSLSFSSSSPEVFSPSFLVLGRVFSCWRPPRYKTRKQSPCWFTTPFLCVFHCHSFCSCPSENTCPEFVSLENVYYGELHSRTFHYCFCQNSWYRLVIEKFN